jgi:hypothetical protein
MIIYFIHCSFYFCSDYRVGNQKVSLRSFALLRWAAPVGCAALHSTDHLPSKKEPLENEKLFLLLSAFPVFARSLPSFGRANASIIQLHSVTLRRLRSSAFQQYDICRPQCFQRLLLRTAIEVGSVITLP